MIILGDILMAERVRAFQRLFEEQQQEIARMRAQLAQLGQ